MLGRILPLSILILIGSGFVYLLYNKQKLKLQWNPTINRISASLLLSLHLFALYLIVIHHTAYMYLLHTDLCTFIYPWLSIALFFNKKKWVKPVLPWAIVGGFLQIATETLDNFYADRLDFVLTLIKHIILLSLALWLTYTIDVYEKRDLLISFIWIFGFIGYVFIVTIIPQLITKNEKLGIFSFGMSSSSYRVVNAAWKEGKVFDQSLYGVLNIVGYPYGTLVLYAIGSGLSYSTSLGIIGLRKKLTTEVVETLAV